jgi:penicillin amidase
MPKRRSLLRRLLFALLVLILLAAGGIWLTLRASVPRLSGQLAAPALGAQVTIARDALGVATIKGASRRDVLYALGFVHAQERYFEMDLMRRLAAGELAELVGAAALPLDKQHRPFRMRARAETIVAALSASDRDELVAYRDGANAGLAALSSRPWEYWLLGGAPRPWSEGDSILVTAAMFFDLNDSTNARELAFSRIKAALGDNVYKFLATSGGPWDAPLTGPAMKYPPLPSDSDLDLSKVDAKLLRMPPEASERHVTPGSNSFAVNGALTSTHAALVANDMHLNLRVPNIWFRARLMYPSTRRPGEGVDLIGVTLPGAPALVAGSNRHVAWAFTNSYGDWTDWVRITFDPADATRYRTADGMEAVQQSEEVIKVHNTADEKLTLRDTKWGPIVAADADGTPLALAWTALQPGGIGAELTGMDAVETADEAVELANRCGMPAQNFVVGDRAGNIAWTIAGRIPKRIGGYDPLLPSDWSQPGTGWDGWLAPADYPRLPNPPTQRLWTANARTLDWELPAYSVVGDGGYDLGARARQIRDDLKAKQQFAPDDMLAIQLDDRAVLMGRWRDVLIEILGKAGDAADLAALKKYTDDWNGRADPASVGYRLTHDFRREVIDTMLDGFAAAVRAKYADFKLPTLPQGEILVDAILIQRPANLLPPGYANWDELLRKCAERVAKRLGDKPGGLAARSWGDYDATHVRHALSSSLPGMGWLLDMPSELLPGDSNMPRVQGPTFGASERFAVEPGHEEFGYFHMPGGQSDNPLSPFYGAGHEDWAQGKAAPFLPGEAKYTLVLAPH